jgi:hypothetical protein
MQFPVDQYQRRRLVYGVCSGLQLEIVVQLPCALMLSAGLARFWSFAHALAKTGESGGPLICKSDSS